MPSTPYSPTAAEPYEAVVAPQPAPTAPSPISTQSPQINGAVKTSGAIATMADGILRGFMNGRSQAQAKQAMQLKSKTDNLVASYNQDAKRLYDMHAAGVPQDSPDYQNAVKAVHGSWGAYMDFLGQHLEQEKKPKGGNKVQQAGQSILERIHSKDPMEQSRAWYEVSKQAGPPIKYQLAQMNTPQIQAQRDAATAHAQAAKNLDTAKARYSELGSKTGRSADENSEMESLGTMLSSSAVTGKATPNIRSVPAGNILGSNLPHGAKDAQGNSLSEVPPNSEWKTMVKGSETFYIPQNQIQQLKPTAQPGTGLPVQANYDPLAGTLDVNHPVGMVPVKTEYKNVTTTDDKGNPITQITPVSPGFRAPNTVHTPDVAPQAQPSTPELHRRDESPNVVTQSFQGKSVPGMVSQGNVDITNRPNIKNPDGTHSSTFSMSSEFDGKEVLYPGVGDGVTYPARQLTKDEAKDQYRKTGKNFGSFSDADSATAYAHTLHEDQQKFGNRPSTYTTTGKTPEQKEATKKMDRHINEIHRDAGGTRPSSLSFDKFSKDNQQAFKAIQAQDLTINGKPGSKTDVGLRKATDAVMNSKDPDLKSNIAVAMNALDSYSKQSLSSHTDGDYNYLRYLSTSWNTIPALNKAFSSLDKSPEGKVYLDNFFRAWTNAATIRSLQGSSGRATQSMYAMLVNELPMIGVNVSNKQDASRKMDMLQDDIDTAASTLPEKLQGTLRKGSARAQSSSDDIMMMGDKKVRIVKRYPNGTADVEEVTH